MTSPASVSEAGARVFIEVPPSEAVLGLVRFAAEIARSFNARLEGRFTQNQALIDLAELPFASEVSFSGAVRALDSARLHRDWDMQAKRARTLFSEAANVAEIDWQFEVTRGRPLHALADIAGAGDVVVLQAQDRTVSAGDVTRAANEVMERVGAHVLIVNRQGVGPATYGRGACISLCRPPCAGLARQLSEHLAERLGMVSLTLDPETGEKKPLAERVREASGGLIVTDQSTDLAASGTGLEALALEMGCPLLLLGSAP